MGRGAFLLGLILFLGLAQFQGPRGGVLAEETTAPASGDPPKVETPLGGSQVPGSSTDAGVASREGKGEKHVFQAEVTRLMDIIINSLYSNKDIFLRELISNASDALDKIRFVSLTDKSALGEGETAKLDIEIKLDREKKILSIRDRGIGMTKDDLIKNLGTIAKSGTSAFVDKMQQGGDMNLIGQFGVGFYSVYLVADAVEVISKNNDDAQHIWYSKADGAFTVEEDTEGESLGRGTQINIYLKDEAREYAEEDKLKELVARYSEFINFPIYLWSTKDVEKEVPVEEEEKSEEAEETTEGDEKEEKSEDEESDSEDKAPKTKKVTEKVSDWELLNEVKAIWLRNPKDVTEEDYAKFYKAIAKDYSDEPPTSWSHFKAEGDVEFRAMLFIPPKAPHDFWDNYYNSKPSIKLYVRRVFISDDFEELIPRYLSFLKGLVDSDTLPLNVSREMLQQHSSLKTIKKKLIRKALDMIKKISEEDEDDTKKSDKDEKAEEESSVSKSEKKGKYAKFWKEYGKAIKLGIVEDASNRVRLARLLRFHSTSSTDKLTSLDEYISRMKDGQKHIYYITGTSKEQLLKSPMLEKLIKKGYEVILFADPVDEYLMQNLTEYDEKRFQNASKEDLKMGDKDEVEKKKQKALKEEFKPLSKWWKELVGEEAEGVKVSNRLVETPATIVTSKYGWSANMERIMQAQALGDPSKKAYMKGKKTLEINPRHPLIKALKEKFSEDENDEGVKRAALSIWDTALIESGFVFEDPLEFAKRTFSLISDSLGVDPTASADEEAEDDEPVEEPEEKSAEDVSGDAGESGESPLKLDVEEVSDEELETLNLKRDEL